MRLLVMQRCILVTRTVEQLQDFPINGKWTLFLLSYSRELIRLCSFLWANNPENKCWKDWAWVCACTQSCPTLFVALWAEVHCVPLSMRFPRQKYWNQLSFPPPGDLHRTCVSCITSELFACWDIGKVPQVYIIINISHLCSSFPVYFLFL